MEDLFAVVRPYITSSSTSTTTIATSSTPSFSGFDPSRSSNFFSLYHSEPKSSMHDPCKPPFFLKPQPLSSHSFYYTSPSSKSPHIKPKQQQPPSKKSYNAVSTTTPKFKIRKIRPKKVREVQAVNRSSDLWAWRKYGEKYIKGSPYPRGYFKCSSSKECFAKKQVEQNKLNPTMFAVTYFGEHNHPAPTCKNSFGGSTRQKALSPQIINATPLPEDFFEGLDEFISSQSFAKVFSSTSRAEVDIFKGLEEFTCLDDF